MITSDTQVRHGYTMEALDKAARLAVVWSGYLSMPSADRYEIAFSAAAEALCAAESTPEWSALTRAAKQAIERAVRSDRAEYGIYPESSAATGSQWRRYWAPIDASPWEDSVVDRLAVDQIWSTLSDLHRAALVALATHEQYDLAAASLGIEYHVLQLRLKRARRSFKRLWHEGETPRPQWGRDERKRRGDSTVAQSRYRRPSRRAPVAQQAEASALKAGQREFEPRQGYQSAALAALRGKQT